MSFARRDPQEIEDLVKRAHERGLREGKRAGLLMARKHLFSVVKGHWAGDWLYAEARKLRGKAR